MPARLSAQASQALPPARGRDQLFVGGGQAVSGQSDAAVFRHAGQVRGDMNIHRLIVGGVIAALAAVLPALAGAQASGPTLEQRLQRVEDELAIRRILADYSATQDA